MNSVPDVLLLSQYMKHAENAASNFFLALEQCKDDEDYIHQLFLTFRADYNLVAFIEYQIEGAFIAEYGDSGSRFRQRMDILRQTKVRLVSSYHEYRAWAAKELVEPFVDDLPF